MTLKKYNELFNSDKKAFEDLFISNVVSSINGNKIIEIVLCEEYEIAEYEKRLINDLIKDFKNIGSVIKLINK